MHRQGRVNLAQNNSYSGTYYSEAARFDEFKALLLLE